MPYEPIKVSAKAFLVDLAPSKPQSFPLVPTTLTKCHLSKF